MHRPSLFLTCIALLFFVTDRSHAQGFGIAVGGNFNSLSDVDIDDREATFDNATGFHAGIFYELGAGPVGLRLGAYYMDIGTVDAEGSFEINDDLESRSFEVEASLFEFPLDLRLRTTLPLIKPYVLGGPVVRLVTDNNDEVSLEEFSFAGNVGAGVEINLPATNLRLLPEIRYSFGLTRFMDEVTIGDRTFTAEDDQQLNVVMIRLGLMF